jgi:Carbohydrate binding domain/Fibronectin type III domain
MSSLRRMAAAAAGLLVAVTIGLGGAASPSGAATNLLVNPGFETGDLTGWSCDAGTASVVSTPVHAGSHALAGTPGSADAQCAQQVSVQPDSAYTLTGWVQGSYVYLGVTGTGTTDTSTWTPSATSWQQLSVSFSTGASTTGVSVYVHGWYGQPVYHADDLSLTGPAGGGGGGTSAPTTPAGLTVTSATSSSVALSWTAVSGATSYNVYRNGALATGTAATSATVTGLTASTGYTFAVTAVNAAGESPKSAAVSVTTASGGEGGTGSGDWRSPVYFMPLDNSPQDITAAMSASGEKNFLLAFVLDSGGCTPAWDGESTQTVAADTQVAATIAAVRAAGGDAGVSFGGYNGTELGQSCGSATALAAAYQAVITKYRLTHIDLDVENAALGDTGNETKRFQAVKILEQNDPGLVVQLTVPMTSVGLPDTGKAEIAAAIAAGARIDVVNIMDFDYGLTSGTQVSADEAVAEDVHTQLKALYGWDDATAYAHTSLQLMNGHTDQPSELFTTDTFTALLGYAQQHHLAQFGYWDLNRDRACDPSVPHNWADGACSSVTQQPYDFTRIVAGYHG